MYEDIYVCLFILKQPYALCASLFMICLSGLVLKPVTFVCDERNSV